MFKKNFQTVLIIGGISSLFSLTVSDVRAADEIHDDLAARGDMAGSVAKLSTLW